MVKPNSVVRFAPSPTGFLPIGNVRTALVQRALRQRHGGTQAWIAERSRDEKRFHQRAFAQKERVG
jgi:tRNA synthetase class I (E and Q)